MKLHRAIVFLRSGPKVRYTNISNPEGFRKNMVRKFAGDFKYANLYDKKTKEFIARLKP